jgi:hypothetical protein
MFTKRTLTHVLLAFALLLAQQAMLGHWATHLAKPASTQDKQLPENKVCDDCVLSVQLATALVGKVAVFDADQGGVGSMFHAPRGFVPTPVRAFSSRAPPTFL